MAKKVIKQVQISDEQHLLIAEWMEQAEKLRSLRNTEKQLREKIFNLFFDNTNEGTSHIDLGQGYILTAEQPYTRTLDLGVWQAIQPKLTEMGVSGDQFVRTKIELEVTQYKAIKDEKLKAVMDEAVITKPGSAALKISAPKDKS